MKPGMPCQRPCNDEQAANSPFPDSSPYEVQQTAVIHLMLERGFGMQTEIFSRKFMILDNNDHPNRSYQISIQIPKDQSARNPLIRSDGFEPGRGCRSHSLITESIVPVIAGRYRRISDARFRA